MLAVMFEILLALTFTFLGAVILVSIVEIYGRYGLRRQQRRRRAILYPLTAVRVGPTEVNFLNEPPRTGLDPSVIALLPKFVYKTSHRLSHSEAMDCSVCLSTIVEEATVRLLPNCKHLFHADCIDFWLNLHTTCPICRAMAEPRQQPKDVELGAMVQQPTALPVEEIGYEVDQLCN